MFNRIIKALGIFKHDYKQIGKGRVYNQKSDFYKCTKCKQILYVPADWVPIIRYSKGCTKSR